MSKPMKSFRLYMPDMSPEVLQKRRKTIGRWNGAIVTVSSIMFVVYAIVAFADSPPNIEMGVATLFGGLIGLIVGIESVKWGRKP